MHRGLFAGRVERRPEPLPARLVSTEDGELRLARVVEAGVIAFEGESFFVKPLLSYVRDLHLYVGLFLCPFVLLFAVSTMRLNHPSRAATGGDVEKRHVAIKAPTGEVGSIPHARAILDRLGVTGEIDYVRHNAKAAKLLIPVSKPGEITRVEINLQAETATIEHEQRGLGEALTYLHKMPGPHNVRFRGNWVFMSWWAVTTDAAVLGILVLTISGLYLWWKLKVEKTIGWVLVGGGMVTVALLVGAVAAA